MRARWAGRVLRPILLVTYFDFVHSSLQLLGAADRIMREDGLVQAGGFCRQPA